MTWLYSPYLVPLLIATIVAVVLAVLAWGRRPIPGSGSMALLMLVSAEWTLTYAMELASPDQAAKLFWNNFEYLAVVSLPLIWLAFVLRYGGWLRWARPRNLVLASLIPSLTLALLWTNAAHHLFYLQTYLVHDIGIPMLVTQPGPWYYVNVAYGYLLSLTGVIFAVQILRRSAKLYRGQTVTLIIGLLAPWLGNALFMFHCSPVPNLDLTPFGFIITGIAALFSLLHYRLLDIMPVARAAVVEGMEHGVLIADVYGRVVDANPAARRLLNRSANALIGHRVEDILPTLPLQDGSGQPESTVEVMTADGPRLIELHASALQGTKGQANGWMVVLRDVTEHLHARQALVESETNFRQLFSTMTEGFALHEIICDDAGTPVDYRFLEVNPAFEELTGISTRQAIGRTASEVLPNLDPELIEIYGRVATIGEAVHIARFIAPLERTYEIVAYSPRPGQFATVFMDITERMKAEERLNYLAYYDELTGLPNRVLFVDRLQRELAHSGRQQTGVALLLIDLDRFKEVNDTLGHSVGDKLLSAVAQRLSECLRDSDTVARMGGDEFLIILPGLTDPPMNAEITALRLQAALSRPFPIDGQDLYISCSIGITVAPTDASTVETLMRNADMAMYRAKEQGRDTYCFFAAEMGQMLAQRHMLAAELRKALDANELYLTYQPQVDMTTRRIFGVEALLRWRHPMLGEISPLQFIPVAEETGLIEPIGDWVLRTACAQMHAWRQQGCGDISVAVNLSARQFERRHIVETVRETLAATGLEPEALELEITESTAMQDIAYAIETLGELRSLGIRIAIDDFGTGHCSFGYLKRFPVSTLKIDRVFIRDIADDSNNAAIVQAIAVLGQALDLTLIAECVETVAQLEGLQARGCQRFQGYLFSRPLTADDCGLVITNADRLFTMATSA